MSTITIRNSSGDKIEDNFFLFPAGEIGIKLDKQNYKFWDNQDFYVIDAHVRDSNGIMRIAMVQDAIRRLDNKAKIKLYMPYVPYARQDRVCVEGEAHSLRVFANLINSLEFSKVVIVDPHSLVCEALFNNVNVISQLNIFQAYPEIKNFVLVKMPIFISPDAGANKKTAEIAAYFSHTDFIRCDKLRELSTGKIKETIVYADDLKGRDVMILDDILDGGRSFIEIAKILKTKNCGKIYLFCTHGIFSQGVKVIIDSGIDMIFTTDSYQKQPLGNYPQDKINIIRL